MEIALVTGTSGMVLRIALAKAGYQVYAGMRSLSKAAPLPKQRRGFRGNLGDGRLASRPASMPLASPPRPGGCAVVMPRGGATPGSRLNEHRAIFETNYFGAMRCIHAVLSMRERQTGSIVNITSVEGRLYPNQVAYSSSKWAWSALEGRWPTR